MHRISEGVTILINPAQPINDKLTDAREEALHRRTVANYRQIEKILQSATPKQRATMIKQNGLDGAFDADGTLRAEKLRELGENVIDGQTDTQGENGAQSAPVGATEQATHNHQYMSPDLWHRGEQVEKDLAELTRRRRSYAGGENSPALRVFDGELGDAAKKNYKDMKRAFAKLSDRSGGKMQMVLLDGAAGTLGAHLGDTLYISSATLEDGRWTKTLIEEATHFTQGTEEHRQFAQFLGQNEDLLTHVTDELTAEGNAYGFTMQDATEDTARSEELHNEQAAHMAAKFLDDGRYIERLVRQNSSLAGKVMQRLSDIGAAISRLTDKEAQKQYRRVKQASQMFENAVTSAGWRYANGVIEKDDEEKQVNPDYNIIALDDGKVYVQASRNVIDGEDVSTWRRQISDFFDQLLDGNKSLDIPTMEGDVLTITKKETADKARDNHKQEKGVRVLMTDEEFLVKLHAEAHIDELAEISQKDKAPPTPDTKNHSFAASGFSYRTAYFQDFDGKYYKVRLSIGNDGTTATVYNVGKIKEGDMPSANLIAVVGSTPRWTSPSVNSIAQNSKKSSDAGDFSLENVEGEAKQQTADDFSDLLASAGIEGEAAEIRGDLAELYRIANEADEDNDAFVDRVANRIAMEMARKGTPQNGETQDEMAERLRKEILARADLAQPAKASKAENGANAEKQAAENEPKPKKTGYTYDDVNAMLDDIRKSSLKFETASGVVEGQIFRNDRWDVGKRIYETLKMNELGSKRELSRKIASMIVDAVKVNEKGADGKTVGKRLSEMLGKDGIADAKEAIALDVAAALGDRDAKKYNKRMNDLKYAAEQLSNMKKGKYVNAANSYLCFLSSSCCISSARAI